MSNSDLICYTQISPNRSTPRNDKITDIAIHCMAGHLSLRDCGNLFANPNTGASSNYGINDDGEIGMFVEEKDRSWCTSSRIVDNRAVTIEVASDASGACKVTDAALASTIKLCADICKRNGIKKLIWKSNKSDRVNKVDGANMQVHRDYASKSCPGDYLYGKMPYNADEVNKILNGDTEPNYIVDGLDYSLVYDFDFYLSHNEDVKSFYGSKDKVGVFDHFLKYGMKEARWAKEDFNVITYKDNYKDLQEAYGTDAVAYYEHYIKWGCNREHRNGAYHIVPVCIYEGINYEAVYDGAFYRAKYKDLQDAYGDNYDKYIMHFVKWGMKERRIARDSFNVNYYMTNYKDLREAYGSDYPAYYLHYIKWGKNEGRVADKLIKPVEEYYTFKEGDSIDKIATRYKLTVDKLLRLNGITFKSGQKLKIKE